MVRGCTASQGTGYEIDATMKMRKSKKKTSWRLQTIASAYAQPFPTKKKKNSILKLLKRKKNEDKKVSGCLGWKEGTLKRSKICKLSLSI